MWHSRAMWIVRSACMRWGADLMRIDIGLHGVLLQLAGAESITLQLPDGADTQAALDQLAQLVPAMHARLAQTAVAIGDTLVSRNQLLSEGDVLALIPPVSGG